jgi:hypothetical protein
MLYLIELLNFRRKIDRLLALGLLKQLKIFFATIRRKYKFAATND